MTELRPSARLLAMAPLTSHTPIPCPNSRAEAGTPGRSRTCGLPLRKGPLYPAELRGLGRAILLGSSHALQMCEFTGSASHVPRALRAVEG